MEVERNEIIEEVKQDFSKLRDAREKLISKFGADNPDLQKLSVFFSDIDKERKTSTHIDKLFPGRLQDVDHKELL